MQKILQALVCLTVICSLPACKYFSKETTQPVEVTETVVAEVAPEPAPEAAELKEVA